MIENQDYEISDLEAYLDCDEFYKQVILYRIKEYFQDKDPTKKELLRLLSLWEMNL